MKQFFAGVDIGATLIVMGAGISVVMGIMALGKKAYQAYASDNSSRIKRMSDTIKDMKAQQETDAEEHRKALRQVHERVDDLYTLLAQKGGK